MKSALIELCFNIIAVILFVLNNNGSIHGSLAWNFPGSGLPRNVLIWRFTIWRNRAFLAVPRWAEKPTKIPFTLLEAPWPEAGAPLQFGATVPEATPFPDAESQEEGNCKYLQSVSGLDSDARGRLWILDSPIRSIQCPAKIIIFDLRRNEKITETELGGVPPHDLKCLVIDPVVGYQGFQAYVSDPGDGTIIVYNLGQQSWWRLKLSGESYTPKLFTTDLAIARKSPVMYLTGYPSHDLFSIDLEAIRNDDGALVSSGNGSIIRSTSVALVGSKMGSSSGLICDFRGGVHYFMVTEAASVRWDSRHELEPEEHSVRLQSEIVPCITDYAIDAQRNIWGIVNDSHPLRNETKRYSGGSENRKIERRTVQIYKYHPFVFQLPRQSPPVT